MYMSVNVNGIYIYVHVCEQVHRAHSVGTSAVENLCIIIMTASATTVLVQLVP